MPAKIRLVLSLTTALALACGAVAHADGVLSVQAKGSLPVTLAAPVTDVMVGDPAVADVSVIDHHHLVIHGRAPGRANITALGAGGRTVANFWITVGGEEGNRVSVFRGATRSDYVCAGNCVATASPSAVPPQAGGPGPAPMAVAVAPPPAPVRPNP